MAKLPPALAKEPVDTRPPSPEEHARERRREILGRVIDVFAKRGYQGATIDHLIAGGETSMGVFYKLFEGKEDCFVQAFDLVVEEAETDARAAAAPFDDWGARVSAGLRSLLELVAANPFAARLVLVEAQSGGTDAVRRYGRLQAEATAVIRSGRAASNAVADLPESFEEATVSGALWLIQNRLVRGESIDAAELHPRLAKMVLEPYLGRRGLEGVLHRTTPGR
jgi:AcrR family transcriptional regulator